MLCSALLAPQVGSTYSNCCLLRVTFLSPHFQSRLGGGEGVEKTKKHKQHTSAAFEGGIVKMRFVTFDSPFVAEARVVSAAFVLILAFYTEAQRMMGSHRLRRDQRKKICVL